MTFVAVWRRWILPVFLSVALSGCFLMDDGKQDEQKETYYRTGRSRQLGMDYKGAAEAFEKALEVNPRSSSAHYELGLLYAGKLNEGILPQEERDRNYATAIYHLQKYLQLTPKPASTDHVARQQIRACKLELLSTESFTVLSSTMQSELEQLNTTNTALRVQVDQLKLQLAQQDHAYSNRLAALQAQGSAMLVSTTAPPRPTAPGVGGVAATQPAVPRSSTNGTGRLPTTPGGQLSSGSPNRSPSVPPVKPNTTSPRALEMTVPRSHVVRAGETPASIARKYGVPLGTLLSANPGLDPRRLKVGQSLNVPGLKN